MKDFVAERCEMAANLCRQIRVALLPSAANAWILIKNASRRGLAQVITICRRRFDPFTRINRRAEFLFRIFLLLRLDISQKKRTLFSATVCLTGDRPDPGSRPLNVCGGVLRCRPSDLSLL
jgi:hypothetical protein